MLCVIISENSECYLILNPKMAGLLFYSLLVGVNQGTTFRTVSLLPPWVLEIQVIVIVQKGVSPCAILTPSELSGDNSSDTVLLRGPSPPHCCGHTWLNDVDGSRKE